MDRARTARTARAARGEAVKKRRAPLARRAPRAPLDQSGARSDGQLVALWLAGRPETTRSGYARELRWWAVPSLAALRLSDVVARLDAAPSCAPATTARRVAALRSLLSFGHRVGYLAVNIGAVLRPVRQLDRLSERILDPEQVLALLAAARAAPREGERDHALVRFLYSSAARVSEALGLTWEAVHRQADGAAVTLHGKGSRTRAVWISEGTARELLALPRLGPWVFSSSRGARLAVRDAQRIVTRAAARAGLGAVSPHWMRHAHATHALERGAPVHVVAADLGHASVGTTTRYLHARPGTGSASWLAL